MKHFQNRKTISLVLAPITTSVLILAFLSIWTVRLGTAGIISITSVGGTFSPVTSLNLQKGLDLAKCGDEVQIEAGAILRTGAEVNEVVIRGSKMTIRTPYAHHFAIGENLKISGLSGSASSLNKNQFPVTSLPESNVAVLELGGRGSASLDGTYTNSGISVFTRGFKIKYDPAKKNCKEGNEIVITTTKKNWLPDPDMRVTPSYKPLLPTLQLVGDPLYVPLVSVSDKVAGLKFVGVSFQKIGLLDYVYYSLFDISSSTFVADESQLAQRISFDRNLFHTDHQLGNM